MQRMVVGVVGMVRKDMEKRVISRRMYRNTEID